MEENFNLQPFNQDQLQTPKKIFKPRILLLSILVIVVSILGFYFWNNLNLKGQKSVYAETYRLTPEKISQSAMIPIYLPPKVDKEFVKNNIKFTPEIKGQWAEQKGGFWTALAEESILYFKSDEKLELNNYHLATLIIPDGGEIKSDFEAVEDPQIIAVFPKDGSEAPENSEITIVFNRPMVSLTTLGYLEEKDVPVEISPKTEGRFKWISTRNLQFLPKERLVRSSNYTVKIKSGLVSTDGLEVKGTESKFITRVLRYLSLSQDQTIYNQPISIYFNEPVDLERTKNEISLKDGSGKEISFIAEYGKKGGTEDNAPSLKTDSYGILNKVDNFLTQIGFNLFPQKQTSNEVDKSIIQIYNQKDRFGRAKLWDFNSNYSLLINKAYPEEGDIILNESRQTNIYVPEIINSITAESQKTNYASQDFFDPEGKLWVQFYEEINLDRSKITSAKLKDIGYGEKCIDENLSSASNCEKTTDKKKIYLTFKSGEMGLGESFDVNFEKIVNTEGLTINKEVIKKQVSSYPQFRINSTFPGNNSDGASLTEIIICSNSPLLTPAKEDFKKYITANLDYEVNYWNNSYRVFESPSQYEKCNVGEFHTQVNYGLMPKSNYSLQLNLADIFGQKADYSLSFITGSLPSESLYFYQFQSDYNVSIPLKTKLGFGARNMEYVNVEICKAAPLIFLSYLNNKPNWDENSTGITCQQVIKDRIELPKKYWITNRFNVDIKDYFNDPLGNYILTFTNPNYSQYYYNWRTNAQSYSQVYTRSYLTITNLAVAQKIIQPETALYGSDLALTQAQLQELSNLYWVTNMSGSEPIVGAKVNLYSGDNLNFSGFSLTNEQGIALSSVVADLRGAVVVYGNDSTVIPNWQSSLNWASQAYSAKNIYLYTDKPIYGPGQEVDMKGIYRIGYDGNYEIYQGKKINLKVYNSKNAEVFNQDLNVSDFGTFNAKIILEQAAPLGNYRFCVEQYNCGFFDVQEYVAAAFKVNVKSDKEEYISKDTVNLDIDANYYFGVPLEGGDVSYTISSQDYYFDRYSDGYFNFGLGWYYWAPHSFGDKFILRGKTSLSQDGKAKISQELDLDKLFKNSDDRKSKIIVFDITITNPQSQSVSEQKSFILHQGEFYLGQSSDRSFFSKNEKFDIETKSVDTQGKEIKVNDITLSLYKVDWIYSKRQEATGGYSYTWEKKRELVEKYNFNTDGKGNHSQELKIAKEGEYESEVSATDKRGNSVNSIYNIYVYGEGQVDIKPTTDTSLDVQAEKSSLGVGDEASVIIKSPYPAAKALICIERGKIFDYQIREINGNLYNFTFPIKEEYIPNVYVSVLLQPQTPEVKFGSVQFNINTKEKELNIEVRPDKNSYLPGEEATFNILAKDSQGNPVSAELSVAVVDLSVLALKGNPKKNPLVFFYGGFPLTVQTSSNVKNILPEIESTTPTKGGGGTGEDELAKKARGIFKETAFWQAVVITDNEGKAQVKFTLPDNLTTWQAEALGITKDTKLGVAYQEFTTKKDLMVVPLKPRFVIPGDVFYIGAKIFNQSEKSQKIDIKFTSDTLALDDDSLKNVSLAAGKTDTVYFKVQAPVNIETGEHVFTIAAKSNNDLEDTVIQTVSITPNNTYEVTATANYTSDKISKEYVFLPDNIAKDKGELSIKSSATLAVFLSDALNYLIGYPYGCTEQVLSQLNAIAIVKKGLNIPNMGDKLQLKTIKYEGKEYTIDEVVQIGLNKIYNNQNTDGGFTYWPQEQSNFYLTVYAVEALHNLSLAGYNINQNSISRAADYVYKQITTDKEIYNDENNIIIAAYSLFNLNAFNAPNDILSQRILSLVYNNTFLVDKVSNTSLAYLSIILNRGGFDAASRKRVGDILDNRIKIDSRGASLDTNNNFLWYYYETATKNTALYLKSLTAAKSSNPVMDKVVRWILNSKEKDGAWGSTNNTLSVIDAFTDFLQWKRETESDFNLDLSVNNKSEGSFSFNKNTILDQFNKQIFLKDLKFGENNLVQFEKTNNNQLSNNLYYDLSLKYYLSADQVTPRDEGFSITRGFYALDDKENKNPLTGAKVGDVTRAHLQIIVPESRNFVSVEDYIPSGMEIVNLDLATEQKSLLLQEKEILGREFIPDFKELYDDRAFLYKERLMPGVYEFDYFARALISGTFIHLPAVVSEMYFPENFGRTGGEYFEIK